MLRGHLVTGMRVDRFFKDTYKKKKKPTHLEERGKSLISNYQNNRKKVNLLIFIYFYG